VKIVTGVTISGDQTEDVQLSVASAVTGHVFGYGAAAAEGVTVSVSEASTGTYVGSATTDAAGAYEVPLAPGSYRFYLTGGTNASVVPSGGWSYQNLTVSVDGATTIDFSLPVVKLTGTVTDSNG